ncbi:MAG: hypothetical protein COC01_05875 [Bacteroidetes bacterium]|nr:MAG: hypothetical protein COC01_05875 [Bacteroidota bacterium]
MNNTINILVYSSQEAFTKVRLYLLVLLLGFGFCQTNAQNIEFHRYNFENDIPGYKEAVKNKIRGDLNLRTYFPDHKIALEYYLKAYEFNPNNAILNRRIGICYLHLNQGDYALQFFERSLELSPYQNYYILYLLGQGYQNNQNWYKAIDSYRNYSRKDSSRNAQKQSKKRLIECNSALKLIKEPVKVKIVNLGMKINTVHSEYRPIVSADETQLIFTARKPITTGGMSDPFLKDYFEDIYSSTLQDSGWSDPVNIGTNINSEFHEASLNFVNNDNTMLVYVDDFGEGDIYISTLVDASWSSLISLGENINTDVHESSACVSPDGRTLYFSSERNGGKGGLDIYSSALTDTGTWGPAQNIGDNINTEYNEDAVFISNDGNTLYFSSSGHNSIGGYDVFSSTLIEGKWKKPENIGYPINTPFDDSFFVLNKEGNHGYYTSTHEDCYGSNDIYKVIFIQDTVVAPDTIVEVIVDTPVVITVDTIPIPDTPKVIKPIAFSSIDSQIVEIGASILLENIFFDVAKSTLRDESREELNKLLGLLQKHFTMKIEISGHTDNVGSEESNQVLSENRAKAVVDYLIENGIDKSRLVYKGYGEIQPIATNGTLEGRQQNRRTEFKILGK